MREIVVSTFPDFPIIYGIPGYGYSFEQRGLGKTPVLSQRSIFELEAEPGKTVYLRTAVYNVYAGNNWQVGKELLTGAENSIDVATTRPGRNEYQDSITVTLLNDFYSMVPHTLETIGFSFSRKHNAAFTYANKDVGYLLTQPLVNGDKVVLYENRSALKPEEINPDLYLNIPENRSSRLVALADSLKRDTPFDTAGAIKDYLSTSEFVYTLTTEHPEGKDLAEYFLFESKRGYCVHFASAFSVLARLNGIPTRYVTGFLAHIPYDQSSARVSGYSAHAWPEIWTPLNGWTIIEATPPLRYSEDNQDEYFRRYMMGDDYLTSRQLSALTGSAPSSRSFTRSSASSEHKGLDFSLAVFLYVFLIVGACIGFFFLASYLNALFFSRDYRKHIDILSSRIAARTLKAGIQHPASSGWLRWGMELDGNGSRTAEVVQLFIRTFYGNYEPDHGDVELVKSFNRNLKIAKVKAVKKTRTQS